MIPDIYAIFEKIKADIQKGPSITNIVSVETKVEITNLIDKPRHFIPLQSFLLADLAEVMSKEEMMWIVTQGSKRFDDIHINHGTKYIEKVKTTRKVILI